MQTYIIDHDFHAIPPRDLLFASKYKFRAVWFIHKPSKMADQINSVTVEIRVIINAMLYQT